MSLLRNISNGFRSLFRRDAVNSDLDEELQAYLAGAIEENMRKGMTEEQAERAARIAIGSAAAVKDQVHATGWEWAIETLMQDIRYGLRTLRNQPAFTIVAVLTLALGIGVNTGIFTILNAAAFKPLSSPRAAEMIGVYQEFSGKVKRNIHGAPGFSSFYEYRQYRDNSHVLQGLMAYMVEQAVMGGDHPKQVMGTLATCDYFNVLEVRMEKGRGFSASDCAAAGASPVVVLSDGLWKSDFAADPEIVGRSIHLNREPFVVVGVAPAGFHGTEVMLSEWWAPITMQKTIVRDQDLLNEPNTGWLVMRGRMKSGVSIAEARADLKVTAAQLDLQHPGRKTTLLVHQASALDMPEARGLVFGVGAVILCAVGLVLLVACANVANLLLARAAGRRKEIAVRLAIGATRARIIRQLLTESMLLSVAGGTLGTLLSFWSSAALVRFILTHLPPGSWTFGFSAAPDLRVMVYAFALSLLTGIVFGLAPALQSTRPDLTLAMKEEGSDPELRGSRMGFLRNALVSTQVAVSMILLLAAGLLMRGLLQAQATATGFEMHNIVTATFELTGAGYDQTRAQLFHQQVRERVAALPGVDRVADVELIPLNSDFSSSNFKSKDGNGEFQIEYNGVQPDFFSLVRIPIVRGRNFTGTESATGAPVLIVTEATAREIWPGKDALGKVLTSGKESYEVIGVAGDAQVSHLGDVTRPYMYMTIGPKKQMKLSMLTHTVGDAAVAMREIREVVADLDRELPVNIMKLEDNMEFWRTPSRIVSMLSGFLGGLALVLASIGVYGMVSYSVSRRVREIGIRMALGADGGSVMRLVLRKAMLPVIIGAMIGIAGCAAVSGILADLLYGVSPHDPFAFGIVPALLMAVALLACYLPARRAMRVNPVDALRCG